MGLLNKREKTNKQLKSSDFIPRTGSAVTATYAQAKNRLAAIDDLTGYKKIAVKTVIYIVIVALFLGLLYGLVPPVRRSVESALNAVSIALYGPCTGDNQLIHRYNSHAKSHGVANLTEISAQVKNKKRYANDPTCVYIATVAGYAQISSKGIGEAQKQYEQLSALKKDGRNPSDAINDGLDTKQMFTLIEELVKEGKQDYHGQG